jgi:hypothetical protein
MRADRERDELGMITSPRRSCQRNCRVEPSLPSLSLEHDGHSVVHGLHRRAGGLRDNRARLDNLAVARHPALPNAGERERFLVGAAEEKRSRRLRSSSVPLVESRNDDEASAMSNGFSECRFAPDRLQPRERELLPDLRVLRPGGDETPTQKLQPALRSHHRYELRWMDVVARRELRGFIEPERSPQILGSRREGRPAAHQSRRPMSRRVSNSRPADVTSTNSHMFEPRAKRVYRNSLNSVPARPIDG